MLTFEHAARDFLATARPPGGRPNTLRTGKPRFLGMPSPCSRTSPSEIQMQDVLSATADLVEVPRNRVPIARPHLRSAIMARPSRPTATEPATWDSLRAILPSVKRVHSVSPMAAPAWRRVPAILAALDLEFPVDKAIAWTVCTVARRTAQLRP